MGRRDYFGGSRRVGLNILTDSQSFITFMDALKLNLRAKDQLHPFLTELMSGYSRFKGSQEWEGRAKILHWCVVAVFPVLRRRLVAPPRRHPHADTRLIELNAMKASDEVTEEQSRQVGLADHHSTGSGTDDRCCSISRTRTTSSSVHSLASRPRSYTQPSLLSQHNDPATNTNALQIEIYRVNTDKSLFSSGSLGGHPPSPAVVSAPSLRQASSSDVAMRLYTDPALPHPAIALCTSYVAQCSPCRLSLAAIQIFSCPHLKAAV